MSNTPPPKKLLQAGTNSAETWGKKEEVEARHLNSEGDMQLYVYYKSPDPKGSILVVCNVKRVEP